MNRIRKGDVVARRSHNKDIIFIVKGIVKTKDGDIAILKGLIDRIEADSDVEDLEKIKRQTVKKNLRLLNEKMEEKIKDARERYHSESLQEAKRGNDKVVTGRILHLDGDKRYSQKSHQYYKKLGLNAMVINIPEYKQPKVVYNLLKTYNPDILVITGHDGMIKKEMGFYDVYNYRNSKYFIDTVKEARRYDEENHKNLVIFAGACQSYFEGLISAGANFASSPARILIDFLDPLVVAEKVAFTEKYKYITIDDIYFELRDGKKGVGGIGANGTMRVLWGGFVTQM